MRIREEASGFKYRAGALLPARRDEHGGGQRAVPERVQGKNGSGRDPRVPGKKSCKIKGEEGLPCLCEEFPYRRGRIAVGRMRISREKFIPVHNEPSGYGHLIHHVLSD